MSYDGFGRLAQIVERDATGSIVSTNKFVWYPGDTQPAEDRDGSGSVIKRYYPQDVQYSGANYYYTRDHLGSVRELTDSSGAVQARYDYDPYGQQIKVSGTGLDSDFGYAGYYKHSSSGLNFTQHRAYEPALGRWLSRDPIGERGGINLYGYVGNNPVYWVDPLGLAPPARLNGAPSNMNQWNNAVNNTVIGTAIGGAVIGGAVIGSGILGGSAIAGGEGGVTAAECEAAGRMAELAQQEANLNAMIGEETSTVNQLQDALNETINSGLTPSEQGLVQELQAAQSRLSAAEQALEQVQSEMQQLH